MLGSHQIRTVRISGMLVTSFVLICTVGCHRDPNVRKQNYLASGKKYEANGQYKQAAIQFANAIRIDKGFAPAYYELAKTNLKLNSLQAAYQNLKMAVDADPSNADARIALGDILLGGGEPDRAKEQAKAVLAMDANNADAYALLAHVAQKNGDNDEARNDMRRSLSIDPGRAEFHSTMALLEESSPGDEGAAEQELQKAASLDPKGAISHLMLAAFLQKKNDLQGAEQQLLQAIAIEPKNLNARLSLAELYSRAGDKAKAEQMLLQAIDVDPTNEGAAASLLDFYAVTQQMDRAEQAFGDLSAKYPQSLGVKITYARILIDHKDYAKATAVTSELTRLDAGDPHVQTLNALLSLNSGKIDDALAQLEKAVKDNPNNAAMQLLLGRVAADKGDLVTAQTSFQQASALNPENVEAQIGLADVAMKRNDPDMLSEVAEKTLQAHPDYGLAFLWKGMAESRRKEYSKAEADFQAMLKRYPDNPTGYIELAQLRFAQGHIPEAIAMLEKALEKNPNSARALVTLVSYMAAEKQPPAKMVARVQAQIAKQPQNGSFYSELAYLELKTNDFKGAVDNSRKAMQINPADPLAIKTYSESEVALGDVDAALATWRNWVGSHPADAGALEMLGSLEEAKGDDDKAIDAFKKALQLDPNSGIAANNLAYLMVETQENSDIALTLAQTARRLLPDNPETADTLAWVLYYKENYIAARDLLESSVKTYPDSASIHLHLGMTYGKLDDKTDAIAQLKKAATLARGSKLGLEAASELANLQEPDQP